MAMVWSDALQMAVNSHAMVSNGVACTVAMSRDAAGDSMGGEPCLASFPCLECNDTNASSLPSQRPSLFGHMA